MAEEKAMSGWLEKKGEVNTAWKKRWFEIRGDRVEYRKAPTDTTSKGAILLAGAAVQVHPPKEGHWQQRLSIEDKTVGRTYWLRGNLNSLKEWSAALNTQITRIAAGPPRTASASSSSRKAGVESSSDSEDEGSAGDESLGQAIKEGSMEKQGEKRKGFQTRYFRLYASQLVYYKQKGDTIPRGRIALVSAVVDFARGESGQFEILITPANSERDFCIRIADDHAAKDWHAAIRAQTRPAAKPTANASASAEALKAHVKKHNEKDPAREVQLSSSSHLAQVQAMEEETSMEDEIKYRHDGIVQLEKDMLELNSIFRDMGSIVREQGESLNTIESNMSRALEHSEAGLSEIRKADEIQSKRFFKFGGPGKEKEVDKAKKP